MMIFLQKRYHFCKKHFVLNIIVFIILETFLYNILYIPLLIYLSIFSMTNIKI